MTIRRVVPDIKSKHLDESRAFYVDFLGLFVVDPNGTILNVMSHFPKAN